MPTNVANAQPGITPPIGGSDNGAVEVPSPPVSTEPGEAPAILPSADSVPSVVLPPDTGATTETGEQVVEKSSSREVTDPEEAEEIAARLAQKYSNQSGPSARQAGPVCTQTRFQSCRAYKAVIEQFIQPNPPSGSLIPIGNWVIDMTLQVRTPVQTPTKETTIQFWGDVTSTSPGTTIPGQFSFQLQIYDPKASATTYYTPYLFPMNIGGGGYQQFEHYVQRNAVDAYDKRNIRFTYIGDSTANNLEPNPAVTRTTTQFFRCDNAQAVNYGTGCVNSEFSPTVDYSSSRFPNISQTVTAGQVASGYGEPSSFAPLQRGQSADNQANRDASCPSSSQQRLDLLGPKPTNMQNPSCDEYPFASTVQGGFGSTVRWVPLAENTDQGQHMVDFYRKNRVMPGDYFYARVI